jgi:hypothetical protein
MIYRTLKPKLQNLAVFQQMNEMSSKATNNFKANLYYVYASAALIFFQIADY